MEKYRLQKPVSPGCLIHARGAVSVAEEPIGACIEIDMITEIVGILFIGCK